MLREEVARGRAEKEAELRERLAPAHDPRRQLEPGGSAHAQMHTHEEGLQ
jgi:hypothetical protein